MPHTQVSITLREAPKIAEALDEYRKRHLELPTLYGLRFGQLADSLRDAYERGLAREKARETQDR